MAESSEELYSCLLKWLEGCLELGGTLRFEAAAVNDGNSLAECLVQLAPDFFTPSWRSRIMAETGGNWKLRWNNLKKIHRSILDYYDTVLHVSLDNFKMPDLALVAEVNATEDAARLIQLVLGIAIHCEQKDTYIQAIMGMQQDVQHVVMGAIQDLMSQESPSMVPIADYKALEEKNEQVLKELEALKAEEELLKQENYNLSAQLKNSRDELLNRNSELDALRRELTAAKTSAGISGGGKSALQRQLDIIKMEKLQFETERDEYKHKCEELGGQLQELSERSQSLAAENEEISILRDSIEEMKYLESKVKNYESVISKYKAKVEDAQEVKRQLKVVEDRNIMYMQQNMDLEEELRKLSDLRQQVDSQRQRCRELEADLTQERLHSLEMTQQMDEKSQALKMFQEELKLVKQERDNLSQQMPGTPLTEEFKTFFTTKHGSPMEEPDHGILGAGLVEAFTPELREKMVRLEKENQLLLKRVETAESASSVGERDFAGVAKTEPESRSKAMEQEMVVERLRKEGLEWKQRAKEAQEALRKYASENATLEEVKKAKDLEIEKYKKTLNKAKKIITENIGDKKTRAADSLEVQNLKVQLQEKDKQIEQLEREHRQGQASWEREEKLVVSAWHELGLMMHRKFSQDRLLTKQNMSFLAQQRQSLYENPVPIHAAANTSTAVITGDTGHS